MTTVAEEYSDVNFWFEQLLAADRWEEDWRKTADKIMDRYRLDDYKEKHDRPYSRYNILFANTDVLQGVLYQQPPIPDVRPRSKKKDPVALAVSEVIEATLKYLIDEYDFDSVMKRAVQERLLIGRAVVRPKYIADTVTAEDQDGETYEKVNYESAECENVDYNLFRYSPARTWKKVWWVGFGELLSKADLEEQFPDLAQQITLDWTPELKKIGDNEDIKDSRALVWTIWNKRDKKVYVVCTGYKDDFIKDPMDDPLKLKNFFPCPEPLYGIKTSTSLIPVPDFLEYEDQAIELDQITQRITKLVDNLKRRGVYDSSIPALKRLAHANDDEFIPVENFSALAEKGPENVLFELPIETTSKVVLNLYKQRDDVLNIIYAITGISDIIRGSSVASESATAQNIKAQYANSRVGPWQRAIAKFSNALLELKSEIACEHFSSETLVNMTGMQFPTAIQLQLAAQQAQQSQQKPPSPTPSQEEVMAVLRNEKTRAYRVDIETDSTIVSKDAHSKQELTDFTTSVATLIQSLSPAVETGFIPPPAAREILLAATRKFEFGKDIDEAMDSAANYQAPDPQAAEKAKMAADQQSQQVELQHSSQIKAAELQSNEKIEQAKLQNSLQLEAMRHNHEQQVKSMEIFGGTQVDPTGTGEQAQTPFQMMHGLLMGLVQVGQQLTQVSQALGQIAGQNELLIRTVSAPTKVIRDATGHIIGAQKVPSIQ